MGASELFCTFREGNTAIGIAQYGKRQRKLSSLNHRQQPSRFGKPNRPTPRKWRGRPGRNRTSSHGYAVFDRPVPARRTTHPRDTPAFDSAPPDPRPTWQATRRSGTRTRPVSCPVLWARRCVARARPFARRLVSGVVVSAFFSFATTLSRSRLAPFAARRPSRPRTSLARETCTPDSRGSTPPPRAGRLRRHRRRLPHREEEGRRGRRVSAGTARTASARRDDEDGECAPGRLARLPKRGEDRSRPKRHRRRRRRRAPHRQRRTRVIHVSRAHDERHSEKHRRVETYPTVRGRIARETTADATCIIGRDYAREGT